MQFEGLNERQLQAVETTDGPLLILAGAGSGKTRTLTCRIANILEKKLAKPSEILAITFTNKAAQEMKQRIAAMVGDQANEMQVSTFHSFCVKILRQYITLMGYPRWFSIYDEDDTLDVVKACLARMNLAEKQYAPRLICSRISEAKNKLISPNEFARYYPDDFRAGKMAEVYAAYEAKLKEAGALDFDDLLLKTLELFSEHPEVLSAVQHQFRYVHVDEYQDTNKAQYLIIRLIAAYYGNICVVGDDDQSIYGWRGADIRNILDFEKDFPNTQVIRLEQNYRSTNQILDAANSVIAHNLARKDKHLWSDKGRGEPITLYNAEDEKDEARFFARTIAGMTDEYSLSDFAILYRTNAQSRAIEEALLNAGLRYSLIGSVKFYERREVKDIIAYLRLILNHSDDVALKRVINVPRRGIGEATVKAIENYSAENNKILWEGLQDTDTVQALAPRSANSIKTFIQMITKLESVQNEMGLVEFIDKVIQDTGYEQMYLNVGDEESLDRVANIREFRSTAVNYLSSAEGDVSLADFLSMVALVSDVDRLEEKSEKITLMTLHSAKGLEFPVVFLAGLEEGIFPSYRSTESDDKVEEERRLCYVGITRAMERLYLSRCEHRLLYGRVSENEPSRFIAEIPPMLINKVSGQNRKARFMMDTTKKMQKKEHSHLPGSFPAAAAPRKAEAYPVQEELKAGDKVRHSKFGVGTIVGIRESSGRRFLAIAFDKLGIKELLDSAAPLEKL